MSDDYQRVLERLLEHIRPKADEGAAVHADTDLVDEVGLDSINVMDVVMHIEDEFDVIVPMNRLAKTRTPAQLAELVLHLEEEN